MLIKHQHSGILAMCGVSQFISWNEWLRKTNWRCIWVTVQFPAQILCQSRLIRKSVQYLFIYFYRSGVCLFWKDCEAGEGRQLLALTNYEGSSRMNGCKWEKIIKELQQCVHLEAGGRWWWCPRLPGWEGQPELTVWCCGKPARLVP